MDSIYFVQDLKAGYYGPPFVAVDDVSAIRLFDRIALQSGSDVANNPEDFVLVNAYSYDSTTCNFVERNMRVRGMLRLPHGGACF